MVFGIFFIILVKSPNIKAMSREIFEFSNMIDEQFDFEDSSDRFIIFLLGFF